MLSGRPLVASPQSPPPATHVARVNVGGYVLQFNIADGTSPAILFEAGGGDNSSVWRPVVQIVRPATGARLITYDRAGFGWSEPDPGSYAIQNEVEALERGLAKLGIEDKLILVAHSYGGFITTMFAERNRARVQGVVLVDANLAGFFTEAEVKKLEKGVKASREQIKKENAALLRVVEAFPATVTRMKSVQFPPDIPVIDIVAERPPVETDAEIKAWHRAHEEFVNASPARKLIVAIGSGHYVMQDAPQLVGDAVRNLFVGVTQPR